MGLVQLINDLEAIYVVWGYQPDKMVRRVMNYCTSCWTPKELVPEYVKEDPLKFVEETIEKYKRRTAG